MPSQSMNLWQWRRFCDEKGGIEISTQNDSKWCQLLCEKDQQGSEFLLLLEEYEETFSVLAMPVGHCAIGVPSQTMFVRL
jgi:hypothetical protein